MTWQGLPEPFSQGMGPTKAWAPRRDPMEVVEGFDAVAVGSQEADVHVEGGRVAGVEADRVDSDAHGIAAP